MDLARRRREASRAYHLKMIHRMTVGQYAGLLARQDGVCFICRRARGIKRALTVDHDHAVARLVCPHPEDESCPGCWRGLLCARCNNMLGHARDDVKVFARAIAYLNFPPAQRNNVTSNNDDSQTA